MQRTLGVVIAVQLAAGALAVAIAHRPVEVHSTISNEVALRPGQTEVTGVITFLKADSADGPPLKLPVTIAIPQRGTGGASISNALPTKGGKRLAIVWDGGTPLVIASDDGDQAALDVTPAPVEVSAAGVRWLLDGHPVAFGPGRYRTQGSVAVGTAGLATPKDRVDFAADATTALTTHGGAFIDQPLAPLTLTGPGAVRLEGRLRVRTGDGPAQSRAAMTFRPGAFEIKLTSDSSGIAVIAFFEGRQRG